MVDKTCFITLHLKLCLVKPKSTLNFVNPQKQDFLQGTATLSEQTK